MGLPTSGDPWEALWAVTTASGMPIRGDSYPGRSDLKLTNINVFGVAADMAQLELEYRSFAANVGTSSIIEVGATTSTFSTNMMPGTKQAFKVDFVPTSAESANGQKSIFGDLVAMTLLRPLATVRISQLQAGTLDIPTCRAFADNVGKVNSDTWMGYDPGSWLIADARATVSRYGGFFQKSMTAIRQGSDKWIYLGVLRSSQTGRYAVPDDINDLTAALKASAYAKGVRTQANRGLVRVDPYDTLNFAAQFGFSGN